MADGGFDTTPFALRMTLIRHGYTPVPITDPDDDRTDVESPGKSPLLKGWPHLAAETLTEGQVRGWRDPGTGILARTARGVDIDVLDPDLAARLRMLTVNMLGPTPLIRVGRAPKTLFVYRSADQAAKLLTSKMMLRDGTEAQVEMLGTGQQFVAFGIHPVTRQPYAWETDSPLTVPLAGLPAVTQEQLIALRDAAEAMMREAGAAPLKDRKQKKGGTKPESEPRSPGLGLPDDDHPPPTIEEVADALRAVPNDCDWSGWVAMGGSIFDALADDGEDLFLDWSRQHAKHDDDAARRKWASFKTSPSVMTKAYLFRCARDNGWKPEREKQRHKPRQEAPRDDDGNFLELTEDGVAIRFAQQHGHEFRYCHDTGKWFVWTGTHWQMNRDRLAFQAARELVRALTDAAGKVRPYRRDDILHIRGVGTSLYKGDSPVQMAREAIGLAIVLEQHGAGLFGRGARPAGVLKHKGRLTSETHAALRTSWDSGFAGGEKSGRTAILEEDMDFTALMLNSVDAQFLEMRKFQLQEVARVWRVPLHLLADLDRVTHSNAEQMGQQFLTYTLLPLLRAWQDAMRLSLLTAEERRAGYYVEFLVDDLARADIAARFTAYSQAIAAGVLNPNEIRSMENRPGYDGGEVFTRPVNSAPVNAPVKEPADAQ